MDDELIHIRVGRKIKKEMRVLIDEGLFTNQSEIAREGIRDLLLKYQHYKDKYSYNDGQSSRQSNAAALPRNKVSTLIQSFKSKIKKQEPLEKRVKSKQRGQNV